MFEHVVLRGAELEQPGAPVTVGQIAEALLYYQKAHLIIDSGTLMCLAKQIGFDTLRILLKRPELSSVYCPEMLGIPTTSYGVTKYHSFATIMAAGSEPRLEPIDVTLTRQFERQGFDRSESKKFSKWFSESVKVRKFSGDHFVKGGIPAAARQDLGDSSYILSAVRQILNANGEVANFDDLKFEVLATELGCCIFSNIDYESLNRQRVRDELSPLSDEGILSILLQARADVALAAHYGGGFCYFGDNIVDYPHPLFRVVAAHEFERRVA
ncbi:hypothetical protein [Burkholderia cepacia]|uniref:hypothetical protein n=1 Tax=Burkholderia cepacia TaxID=292 RepID=UPI000ABE79A6|nr:hypothetical protein [Burkholderia cepacia]